MMLMTDRPTHNRRSAALLDLGLAVALPLVTQIATVTGKGRPEVELAREQEGPITPANGAFVIWAPIFACILAYGVRRVRLADEFEDSRAEALAHASLIGNILWSLNAQFRDFGWQSLALISGSAVAATGAVGRYTRGHPGNGLARTSGYLLAPLAGWLSVATFANLETTQRATGVPSPAALAPPVTLLLASAATLGGVAATQGNEVYTAAAAWGLAGIARKNVRTAPHLAALAGVGLIALMAATWRARRPGTRADHREAQPADEACWRRRGRPE
jgi:tryptophan-rich sensory protein